MASAPSRGARRRYPARFGRSPPMGRPAEPLLRDQSSTAFEEYFAGSRGSVKAENHARTGGAWSGDCRPTGARAAGTPRSQMIATYETATGFRARAIGNLLNQIVDAGGRGVPPRAAWCRGEPAKSLALRVSERLNPLPSTITFLE